MPVQISPAEVLICFSNLVKYFPPEVDRIVSENLLCAALAHDHPESDPLLAVGRAIENGLLVRDPGNLLRRLPPTTKIPVGGGVSAKAYKVMAEAVKWGVAAGYYRAYKHTEAPDDSHFQQCLVDAIMLNLCEQFSFSDFGEEE